MTLDIAPKRHRTASSSTLRAPIALKLGFSAWVVVWAVAYARYFGPQNFLWFCDLGNFVLAAALWTDSAVLFSWQAVSLLLVQLCFAIDFLGRLLFGHYLIGATAYMFDPNLPLLIRGLSLFHVAAPLLLGWGLVRFGYDRRAFALQLLASFVLLPISYAFGPTLDINWTWGPFERQQHWVPSPVWFFACLIGYPVLLYLPSHFALRWLVPRIRARLAGQ